MSYALFAFAALAVVGAFLNIAHIGKPRTTTPGVAAIVVAINATQATVLVLAGLALRS